jgi:site-specific recombinase XerD
MKRMQPMNDQQLDALRKAANETGPREAAMIALMTRHFIRASELAGTVYVKDPATKKIIKIVSVGLKTSDVNLRDGRVTITRLKGSTTKTEAFRPGEREILEAWLQAKPESKWLFPGRNPDEPMDRKTTYNIYRGLCVKAGIPATCAAPHASRHTIGQMMAEKGAQAKLIQQAAGHKSLSSSGQYYEFRQSHVDSEVSRLLGLTEAL